MVLETIALPAELTTLACPNLVWRGRVYHRLSKLTSGKNKSSSTMLELSMGLEFKLLVRSEW